MARTVVNKQSKAQKEKEAASETVATNEDVSPGIGPSAPRPMRLKVLYSLDDNMSNCLARAKEIAQVRVVYIDPDTPIGLVDLKTCASNITFSSPELLHQQGCDYSVYSYDYTEPDTPMVGLGLLSWVLSLEILSCDETMTSAHANRLVSGRVQKNLLGGLFAGDAKETLEVRMRLCRVATMNQAKTDGPTWWSNGQPQQQPMQPYNGYYPNQPMAPPGIGAPLYSQYGYAPQYQQYGNQQQYPGSQNQPYLQQQPYHPVTQPEEASSQPIIAPPLPPPSSAPAPAPPPPIQSHPPSEVDESPSDPAEPPIKRRKTVSKRSMSSSTVKEPKEPKSRGRPRKQSLVPGPPSEASVPSLNRTVSEPVHPSEFAQFQPSPSPAASIDPSPVLPKAVIIRQLPNRPSEVAELSKSPVKPLPPPFEAAFPIPPPPHHYSRPSPSRPSPSDMSSSAAPSPVALVPTSYAIKSPAPSLAPPAAFTSKESPEEDVEANEEETINDEDDEDSDVDSLFIGSSPPPTSAEMREDRSPSPFGATSPVLPQSHFKEERPHIYTRETSEALQDAMSREQSPEDPSTVPQSDMALPVKNGFAKDEPSPPSDQADSSAAIKEKKPRKKYPRKPRKPAMTSEAIMPPSTDAVDAPPKRKKGRPPVEKPAHYKKISSKERIAQQMLDKVASGEMPNFCSHCGQIETPTWRKVKIIVPGEEDEKGERGEDTEQEILLCNPCGLWYHNHKTMRPENLWDKPDDDRPKPTRRARTSRVRTDEEKERERIQRLQRKERARQALLAASSIGVIQASIAQAIQDDTVETSEEIGTRITIPRSVSSPPPVTLRDGEWPDRDTRRVQSSPLRLGTSVDPICLLSPEHKNTRRVLFPEAKKSNLSFARAIGDESQEKPVGSNASSPGVEIDERVTDKENHPPLDSQMTDGDWEADIEDLIKVTEGAKEDDASAADIPRPTTPTSQMYSDTSFKTPTKLTPFLGTATDSPWKNALFAGMTPSQMATFNSSAFATPNAKLLAPPSSAANRMSPASGEIMVSMLEEWSRSNPVNKTSPGGTVTEMPAIDPMNMFGEFNMDFQMNDHDFMMTSDHPMPSSPPPMFSLYDEGPPGLIDGASSSLWSDMMPSSPGPNGVVGNYTLNLFGDGDKQFNADMSIIHPDLDLDLGDNLVVDFSDFVNSSNGLTKNVGNMDIPDDGVTMDANAAVANAEETGKESSTTSGSPSADGK